MNNSLPFVASKYHVFLVFNPDISTERKIKNTPRRAGKTPAVSKSARVKVKVKGGPHKVPLVEPNTDEVAIEGWSDDDDFKIDVLSSARKATIVNSGSSHRQKQGRSVRQKKIRRLVYSSEEESMEEEGEGDREGEEEGEKEEEGERKGEGDERDVKEKGRGKMVHIKAQKIPSRFTFSDDDD